ncbi:unnamed protein product [Cylindrotheca closterium]|uniref:Nephrocystin-3 n=1 Tax=Cylindrotheca closterium TaxID=2856 RepID=A0AAD2FK86_9STRA|nr:unnamed protein product [Cylindrotheca closterium]
MSASLSLDERVEEIITGIDKAHYSSDDGSNVLVLRDETKLFLKTLEGYLYTRKAMDEKYLEVDALQELAKSDKISDGSDSGIFLLGKDGEKEFKPEYQQQTVESTTPVSNMEELYEVAKVTKEEFENIINHLCNQVRNDEDCEDEKEEIRITFAELKDRDRAQEKAADDYSKRNPGPSISWLFDIVRGCIEFTSNKQILKMVELIEGHPRIKIAQAKNRFATPTLTGYRDLNLHIQIQMPSEIRHTCEIQIHHIAIRQLEKQLNGHKFYEYFRSYFAGATGSLEDRLNDLRFISQGKLLSANVLNQLLDGSNEDEDRLKRLADLFEDQLCEYEWALKVHRRLLEIRKMKFGEEHSSLADSYHNMGGVLRRQGRLEDAMAIYEKSLKINTEKNLIEGEQSSVADTYNSMGGVLEGQGKLEDAMAMYEKSLEIKIKNLGGEHSSVAVTYSNMAIVLQGKGRLEDAMAMYEKSLKITIKNLGGEHSSVAITYSNMAGVLQGQGKLEDAMKTYEKSLEINIKNLGGEHSTVAITYNNMGLVLERQGRFEDAMAMYEKSLAIDIRNLGGEHSSVADTYNNMASVLEGQGKLEDAMAMYKKSLEINIENLGGDHSSVAITYNNMASVLGGQGKLEDAMAMYEKSLEINIKNLGEEHSFVAMTYSNMAFVLERRGKLEDAIATHQKALEIYRYTCGEGHPNVSLSMQKIAELEEARSESYCFR